MRFALRSSFLLSSMAFVLIFIAGHQVSAQGTSGTVQGTVKDQSGAVVPGATVELSNPVSGLQRQTTTGSGGDFRFVNIPFNPYHLVVRSGKFQPATQEVDVRAAVPVVVDISLKVGEASTTISVEAESKNLIEVDSQPHVDVDRGLFEKVPLESASSSVSALVTQTTPGVAADSNGLFHGIGDHAENSFSVDGQPITDQQSKIFSNQIPVDSIQSLEVLTGAPTAEFGGKTSLIIRVATRSGQGVTTPHGALTSSYGTFGTSTLGFNVAYGGQKWGNFFTASGLNTSRFLDPPEFAVMHDKGNEENLFDRVDFVTTPNDSIHLNGGFTRSWFQNPNTFDQQLHTCSAGFNCNGANQALDSSPAAGLMGPTDQRSQIVTFNIAPSWNHLIGTHSVFTLGGFVRKDQYNFYPSKDLFADFAPSLNAQTITQDRKLTNTGARSDFSYVKGIHNIKIGAVYEHTFLDENDKVGTVDPGFLGLFLSSITDPAGKALPCTTPQVNPQIAASAPCATLLSVDLTQGGSLFNFKGHADIKETALYVQDAITKGNWAFNLGIRGDIYRGLSSGDQAEPRAGIAYNIKRTNTVLRVSYARTLESPFNENLVISSTGCGNAVVSVLVPPPNSPCALGPIPVGWRNEFHAGFQQAFGKYLVVDGDYLWKYTHNGYDFGVVAATPIAFPIAWHNSKIPGFTLRVSVPDFHRFTAYVVMSSVAARFFPTQQAGITFLPAPNVFRIDHDERYNQTTHVQYQPWKLGPWFGFNWRYDSGLVAGAAPCFANTATCSFTTVPAAGGNPDTILFVNNLTGLPLTADQEFQGGFTCNGVPAAPSPTGPAMVSCPASQIGSKFIKIPATNAEQDDHNPQRIQPRSLFDAGIGHDNLFKGDRYKVSLRFTAINLANKVALYNYFSTFSGTHYVTPRALTAEIGLHF